MWKKLAQRFDCVSGCVFQEFFQGLESHMILTETYFRKISALMLPKESQALEETLAEAQSVLKQAHSKGVELECILEVREEILLVLTIIFLMKADWYIPFFFFIRLGAAWCRITRVWTGNWRQLKEVSRLSAWWRRLKKGSWTESHCIRYKETSMQILVCIIKAKRKGHSKSSTHAHYLSNPQILLSICSSSTLCKGSKGETDRAPAQVIPGAGWGQTPPAVSVLSCSGEPARTAGGTLAQQHQQGQQGAAAPGGHPETLDQVRNTCTGIQNTSYA